MENKQTNLHELELRPEIAYIDEQLTQYLDSKFGSCLYVIERRSLDLRHGKHKAIVVVQTFNQLPVPYRTQWAEQLPMVTDAEPIIIVGTGPAGLFAALSIIENGLKPIVIERGKDVRARRRDLAAINKDHQVNPDSNYCFGEGGAGTYSDGKLYTRSTKRGNVKHILEILVQHGANPNILFEAHPHIGTNKLPYVVAALRNTIIEHGGQVLFDTRVEDIITESGRFRAVVDQNKNKIEGQAAIIATGHSARDMFDLFHRKSWTIEAKPFALGVRIEHPQALIDHLQYKLDARPDYLPAASYSLTAQVPNAHAPSTRGVFSFCMCPGGFIVPAATAPNEVVVNGMSPSKRNSRFANSGVVVAVEPSDLADYKHFGPLAALEFQRQVEQMACASAGQTQMAPAQRITDFLRNKNSSSLPETSYQPGIVPINLNQVLPPFIAEGLRNGITEFNRKMRGYNTEAAVMVGVESRTSSPVRIPRHPETLTHPDVKFLYPCGEGAGYAGGIVSAAIDGQRCGLAAALAVKQSAKKK